MKKFDFNEELSLRQEADVWNQEYIEGCWEVLKTPPEYARFNVIIKIIEDIKKAPSILEIGCGEGILQSRLEERSYSSYLGIDISDIAINLAKKLENNATRYLVADMESFVTKKKFDVLLFNESIYYAKNPLNLIFKYKDFLKKRGIMIISIFDSDFNRITQQLINDTYKPKNEFVTSSTIGKWTCSIYNKLYLDV